MTRIVAVKDDATGSVLRLEIDAETTVDDIIEASADHWKKPKGPYVLRWGNALLRGEVPVTDADVKEGDALVLLPDPEGG